MSCQAPALDEHRGNMQTYDDEEVLSELRRAWGRPIDLNEDSFIYQDWAGFRATTLREVRRRGLKVPSEIGPVLRERGIKL